MEQLLQELNFTHWTWFVLLFVFLFLEMLVPGIAFLWLSIAAAITGVAVAIISDMSWETQIVIFTLLSVISVYIGRRVIRQTGEIPSDNELLNQRGTALIGRQVTVAHDIKDGRGKVKVGDSLWTAIGPDKKAGEQVTVTQVHGTELTVEEI